MQDREGRIGYWVSGVAHGSLILWAILGGALFRPQDNPPVRTTQVSTISGAEFEALAAAARGAGPVGADATAVASLPDPVDPVEDGAARPVDAVPPRPGDAAALEQPDQGELAPDLSDLEPAAPVDVATDLPEATPPPPPIPPPPHRRSWRRRLRPPSPRSRGPPPDSAALPVAPRSALALDASPRPLDRPAGLVEAFNRRVAEAAAAEAARQAAAAAEAEEQRAAAAAAREAEERRAAEAAAREAEERRAAEAATREAEERRAAEAAAREAEERRAAEAAAREAEERRAAEAAAREAEERRAAEAAAREVEERRAAEAAAREAEERRAAEAAAREAEERRAAEAAAREAEERRAAEAARQAAEREAADRQALEDALREAQGGAGGTETASGGDTPGTPSQTIEGGSGASAGLDPLAAALAGAMAGSGASDDGAAVPSGPPTDMMRLTPAPIDSSVLPDPGQGVPMGDPLTLSERDGLRFAIQNCWNVGALSVEAAMMTVSVGFTLTPGGVPDQNSLRLAGYQGGSEAAAQQAFDVARRAILMCGRDGYPLPASKYGRWRDVVVDFRPDGVSF
ncbi:protein TolA [Paracoccus aestuarii]|uniref:protein TolA n=1 Tax=Paracoccus aestuarii TaxID=453842 RepID=UPI002350C3BB|nr:protein TolA [Paracoccus aestuarii]WCQ98723.1 protein TolA [Paracoccus aestuarii]